MNWKMPALVSLVLFAFAACGNKGERVFGVIELVDQVTADESAWTGKTVSVSGHVSVTSNANDPSAFVDLRNDRNTPIERHVICKIAAGALPEGVAGKTIVVKGTVGKVYRQSYLDLRNVTLDPCEISKQSVETAIGSGVGTTRPV